MSEIQDTEDSRIPVLSDQSESLVLPTKDLIPKTIQSVLVAEIDAQDTPTFCDSLSLLVGKGKTGFNDDIVILLDSEGLKIFKETIAYDLAVVTIPRDFFNKYEFSEEIQVIGLNVPAKGFQSLTGLSKSNQKIPIQLRLKRVGEGGFEFTWSFLETPWGGLEEDDLIKVNSRVPFQFEFRKTYLTQYQRAAPYFTEMTEYVRLNQTLTTNDIYDWLVSGSEETFVTMVIKPETEDVIFSLATDTKHQSVSIPSKYFDRFPQTSPKVNGVRFNISDGKPLWTKKPSCGHTTTMGICENPNNPQASLLFGMVKTLDNNITWNYLVMDFPEETSTDDDEDEEDDEEERTHEPKESPYRPEPLTTSSQTYEIPTTELVPANQAKLVHKGQEVTGKFVIQRNQDGQPAIQLLWNHSVQIVSKPRVFDWFHYYSEEIQTQIQKCVQEGTLVTIPSNTTATRPISMGDDEGNTDPILRHTTEGAPSTLPQQFGMLLIRESQARYIRCVFLAQHDGYYVVQGKNEESYHIATYQDDPAFPRFLTTTTHSSEPMVFLTIEDAMTYIRAALLADAETTRMQDRLLALPWRQLETNVPTSIGLREAGLIIKPQLTLKRRGSPSIQLAWDLNGYLLSCELAARDLPQHMNVSVDGIYQAYDIRNKDPEANFVVRKAQAVLNETLFFLRDNEIITETTKIRTQTNGYVKFKRFLEGYGYEPIANTEEREYLIPFPEHRPQLMIKDRIRNTQGLTEYFE